MKIYLCRILCCVTFFSFFFFFANTIAKQTAYAVSVNVCEDSVNYVTAVMVVVLEIATHETTTGFLLRSFSGSRPSDADVKGS